MATLLCFHAHPDDEAIATGGVMAKAARDGHRVVLVTATRGECGEVADGFLDDGEALGDRRAAELSQAAAILGVSRVEILGYRDSGMMGTPENDAADSFWRCDVEEAADRLAAILRDENVDVITMYDENGVYGHPDHIKVWQVGGRAAEIAGTKKVYEGTVNRTARMRAAQQREPAEGPRTIEFPMGVEEDQLTTAVDVSDYVDVKRQAMRAHASQITEDSFFLKMPDDVFAEVFGTEWFILRGAPAGVHEHDLFTGIDS